jgi:hypothetical protein
LTVLVCEIEDGLRQVGRLDNAADLNSTLVLNELANQEQKLGGELTVC